MVKQTLTLVGCFLICSGLLGCKGSSASEDDKSNAKAPAASSSKPANLEEAKAVISAELAKGKAGIVVSAIEPVPFDGMYKVTIENGPALYATQDGKHFIVGDMYQVTPGNFVNLTEAAKNGDRAKAIETLEESDMIVFAPKGEVKAKLYVFTDVDCGYCQLLHSKVPEMNEMGIQVNYLAFPRAGVPSKSYSKIASAWCAEDKQTALTKLKNREEIPENVCPNNPVPNQYQLGQQIGINGTPALITSSGELIAGYVEPNRLAQILNL